MANLPAGSVFVAGRSKERARRLLDIALELKVDVTQVRTTLGGYIVPEKVGDAFESQAAADVAEKSEPEEVVEKAAPKARAPRAKKATAKSE